MKRNNKYRPVIILEYKRLDVAPLVYPMKKKHWWNYLFSKLWMDCGL